MAESTTQALGAGTHVGPGVTLEGTLRFDGAARIDGAVNGRVISEDTLEVGPDASVEAEIEVGTLVVRGTIEGNVTADDSVEIHRGGKLRGDLKTPALTVHPGALFHGYCDMGSDA